MSVDRDRPFCKLEIGVPAGAGTLASVALAVVCVRPVRWLERGAQNPIPSRTRPLNASALMVLRPKARESRSLPGQPNANSLFTVQIRIRDDCWSLLENGHSDAVGDAGGTRTRSAVAATDPK